MTPNDFKVGDYIVHWYEDDNSIQFAVGRIEELAESEAIILWPSLFKDKYHPIALSKLEPASEWDVKRFKEQSRRSFIESTKTQLSYIADFVDVAALLKELGEGFG